MNRLSNYFECAKLAKQFIQSAEDARDDGDTERALRLQGHAIRELITAMNNVASIAFHHKPKREKR